MKDGKDSVVWVIQDDCDETVEYGRYMTIVQTRRAAEIELIAEGFRCFETREDGEVSRWFKRHDRNIVFKLECWYVFSEAEVERAHTMKKSEA